MTSPNRSVIVRLAMDPSSYMAGATRAAGATTALQREVAKVGPATETSMARAARSTTAAESAMGRLNKATSVLGVNLGFLAKAGTLVGVALSVKSAADFQQSLVKLSTTAGESTRNLHMVGQGLLDMAGQVGISAGELAKGMYTVESGGFHGADGLKVMKAAAQGAIQEQADLGKVTDAVTTILHDYHLPASQAADVTSKLVTAVSHGKTTFDELTGSLHSVTPLASKMGISIADVTGTLSAMTASGESADQATQNMANTLQHLANPTSTMINELAQLGISTDDLQKSLSTRGLAGTLQMVEEAIVQHVDPATQRVLLPALNKSKTAVEDLHIMLGQMPPDLAKMSRGLLDGTVSFSDYRKAVRDTGGQAEVLGTNFLSLFQSSQGFNNVLKAGGPAAQVFTAAMAKAFGTTAALNVSLQTTGENAAATNAAIKDIAGSSAQADGNIRGWAEVQGNFNQQLHEAVQHIASLATEAGEHLLPVLTSALGFVNRDVVPGIEHMGSAVGDAVHWWSQLPGPIKETTLALAGMAIANKIGLIGALTTRMGLLAGGVGRVSTAFREEVAMQRWAATVGGLTGTAATAEAGFSRMAVAGGLATRAMGSMRSGASKLAGVFGGPWGIALVGAVVGVTALQNAIEKHDEEIKKATQDVLAWNKAIALGSGGQTAVQAAQHLDDLRGKIAALQQAIERYNGAAAGGYARGGIGTMVTHLHELQGELTQGTKAWHDQLAAMTPVEEAQARVDIATKDLNDALKRNPPNSQAVTNASMRLHDAQAALAGETERTNRAEKTQIQNLQDQANAALASLDAQRAAQMSQLQLADAIDQYNADANDGQHTSRQLQEEQLGLVDSARQAAQAAADAAAAQAKQNGATDTATASQGAFLKSLMDTAQKLTGPAKQAVLDMITALGGQQTQAQLTAGAINKLGITVTGLPSSHYIEIDAPTDKQMTALHDLAYVTVTLPNGKVVVSADTNPAIGEIQDLLNYARQQSITYRSTQLAPLVPGVSGGGLMGHYAAGGYTGDGAKFTPAGVVHRGEFVFPQESVDRLGVGFLGALAGLPGYAGGGWVGLSRDGTWPTGRASIPVGMEEASEKAAIAAFWKAAVAQVTAPGAPVGAGGNVGLGQLMAARYGWTGGQWNDLYALWRRESGWNNLAQNPTSTAFGIPQFLNSTWATVGYPKSSDSAVQIAAGLRYIDQRYGSPANAWAHETRFGWYDGGGPLRPGWTMAYNGTGKTETIRTADQEASVQRMLRSREMFGGAIGGSTVHSTVTNNTYNVAAAGPSEKQLVRALANHQYQQEFLHG